METMRKTIALILAAIIVLIIASWVVYHTGNNPRSTPPILMSFDASSLGKEDMNVTQGSVLQINITLTSYSTQKTMAMIENLVLEGASDNPLHFVLGNWNTSIPQSIVLNYTFSIAQLFLEPSQSNSTVLTVNIAEDAQPMVYFLEINARLFEAGVYRYASGFPLYVWVTPKN